MSNFSGYDYESIMHYGRNFFAKDKKIPTIVTRDQSVQNRIVGKLFNINNKLRF